MKGKVIAWLLVAGAILFSLVSVIRLVTMLNGFIV